jgi:hypothetical protein
MTVSAVARLMPSPPARVESRKRKWRSGWVLYASMRRCRSAVPAMQGHQRRHLAAQFAHERHPCNVCSQSSCLQCSI